MPDINQFYTSVDMSNDIAKDYEDNVQFVYHEFSNILVDITAFSPLIAGFIDIYVLNKLGVYSITWFLVTLLLGIALCVFDCIKLYKLDYDVDRLFFWAMFMPVVYLKLRSRITKSGGYLFWIWCALFFVVCVFSPM